MHNGDWFAEFVKNVLSVEKPKEPRPKFKVGDAVRVKAGSPVHPDKTGHPGWRSSPYQAAFGRKLVVRGCDTDRNGFCVRVEYDGDVEGMDVRYLEPWNDAEEWNGEKWVAKKVEKWPDTYFVSPVPKPKPAIVINRTNGVLKPATTPFVHPSAIEAEVEAKRLAELVKGEEFVVFEEVGSRRVEKPPEPKPVRKFVLVNPDYKYSDDWNQKRGDVATLVGEDEQGLITLQCNSWKIHDSDTYRLWPGDLAKEFVELNS